MAWISPGGSGGRVVLDWTPDAHAYPDLLDPATVGCLLHLVRQARNEPAWLPTSLFDGGELLWVIEKPSAHAQTRYETMESTLIAALYGVA